MKFIDEVTIHVQAGKGGDGCCSFRREKFIPFGGPDGGNGGKGGDIYLKATSRLATLVDLNYNKIHHSPKGRSGSGNLRSGKSGEDLIIQVPVGTIVWDHNSKEIIGDLITDDQLLLVAKGGQGGIGNHHFKSSTNRAPRKITKGTLGETRILRLELRLLADVGLLGFPNAGKSTLISKVSAAKPRIADYPFTTIEPNLGVVKVGNSSFVMADIPGILEGAAAGVGLGIRFLRHLSRNRLLLHIVDLASSLNLGSDLEIENIINNLIKQIMIINHEISYYDDINLNNITRWIVINKIDLLNPNQLEALKNQLAEYIKNFSGSNNFNSTQFKDLKIFWISAVNGAGINNLCIEILNYLESINRYIVVE